MQKGWCIACSRIQRALFKRTLDLSLNNACTALRSWPEFSPAWLSVFVLTGPNFPGTVTSLVQIFRGPSKTSPEPHSVCGLHPRPWDPALRFPFCLLNVTSSFRVASGLGLTEEGKVKQTL